MIISFNRSDRDKYYTRLEKIFDSGFLSEGDQLKEFEACFEKFTGLPSLGICNGGSGLLAIYEYINVSGYDVIIPANTFWATAVAAKRAGARIIYADCNKEDLCLSLSDLKKRITPATKAVTVVHIGGHIAFEIEEIAEFCRERGIYLVEDCCHAHGAVFNGKLAGSWGMAGVYSFYATKTIPIGEGGMVVSRDRDFMDRLSYYRNYGKDIVDGKVSYKFDNGFNFRMSEIVAALGNVQMERLPAILKWKRDLAGKYDKIFKNRVYMPEGMISGYYKYIVFDYNLKEKTGQVFGRNDLGYNIDMNCVNMKLPNTEWVVDHHSCAPIWFGWSHMEESVDTIREILL